MFKKIDKASIIQNGLTREECALVFELLEAAEHWRDTMVASNRSFPTGQAPTELSDRAQWAKVKNWNGRLVRAVDAVRDLMGTMEES